MKIEFNIYEVTKMDEHLSRLVNSNEFIVVGEQEEHYLIHELSEEGLTLVGGINIQDSAYRYPKKYLKLNGNGICRDSVTLNIPINYLTMDIIEDIQKYNDID